MERRYAPSTRMHACMHAPSLDTKGARCRRGPVPCTLYQGARCRRGPRSHAPLRDAYAYACACVLTHQARSPAISRPSSRLLPPPRPPTLCTLHPAPRTLYSAPCTLHPAPRTLHPAPRYDLSLEVKSLQTAEAAEAATSERRKECAAADVSAAMLPALVSRSASQVSQ